MCQNKVEYFLPEMHDKNNTQSENVPRT